MTEYLIPLFIIITILVLGFYTAVLVRYFLNRISISEKRQLISQFSSEVIRLKFQAFERFTLLLERLSPESLVIREQNPKMNCLSFHSHLLKVIRTEFNHNIAMQIYISAETYEKIKTAREKLLMLINSSVVRVKPEIPALELGRVIIEDATKEVNLYFKVAINAIRTEMEELKL